jgi:hypothetical protein
VFAAISLKLQCSEAWILHVNVEVRPVDRQAAATDEAFRERTIEAEEGAEEPVVAKEARVKEEVVLNKEAEDRTETVQDTVRKTQVEVEDERTRRDPQPGKARPAFLTMPSRVGRPAAALRPRHSPRCE